MHLTQPDFKKLEGKEISKSTIFTR